MSIINSLKSYNIAKKLPLYNIKRSLLLSIFLVIFIPIFAGISALLDFNYIFSDEAHRYILYLLAISILNIISNFIISSKAGLTICYQVNFILTGTIALCLAHIICAKTGNLFVYGFALVAIGLIPVLNQLELYVGILMTAIAAASFIIPYHSNKLMLCEIIGLNLLLIGLTVYKYNSFLSYIRLHTRLGKELGQSVTDPLTGLLNRRGLERKVSITWPLCARHGISTAAIMLDIDFFKKYNDTFGHPQGDRCIKAIGSVLKQVARRESDITARIGGEEFLVFVQDISKEDLLLLAKRIQRGVESLELKHATNVLSEYVTISIGIAYVTPDSGKDFTYLYEAADKALYHAKANGRNCISLNGTIYSKQARTEADSTTPYSQLRSASYSSRIAR